MKPANPGNKKFVMFTKPFHSIQSIKNVFVIAKLIKTEKQDKDFNKFLLEFMQTETRDNFIPFFFFYVFRQLHFYLSRQKEFLVNV